MNKTHISWPKNDKQYQGQSIKSIFRAILSKWLIVLFVLSGSVLVLPEPAHANYISDIGSAAVSAAVSFVGKVTGSSLKTKDASNSDENAQNLPLLSSTPNFDSNAAIGGEGDLLTVDNKALISENGPSGTQADISDTANTGQISKYTVRKGDTLAGIAKMFGVSTNTIVWANDITGKTVKEGQVLVILPVSGTIHTVVKGDTLKGIAAKYKADVNEITQFNDLTKDAKLAIGDSIIIPNGEGSIQASAPARSSSAIVINGKVVKEPYRGGSGPNYPGYYIRPIAGGVKTQGLHGYNAVDLGTPVGTPIMAAADGEVIISKSSGYNGGYGKYVVISHANGTQTLYGHMSNPYVYEGQRVVQGQIIGLSGNTGLSTGPHVHFEVRGAVNPF